MKWVYVEFSDPRDGSHIQPSLCHPRMASRRIAYVCNRYNVKVLLRLVKEKAGIDYGGMVLLNAPTIEVQLDKDRAFWCYQHQASYVLEALRNPRTSEKTPAGMFYRWSSFPGFLIYLSKRDTRRIIKVLESRVNYTDEQAHEKAVVEALVGANASMNPDIPVDGLRAEILKYRGKKRLPDDKVN